MIVDFRRRFRPHRTASLIFSIHPSTALFLGFLSKVWINIMTCAVFWVCPRCRTRRFLTWPMQHSAPYASRPVDGAPTIIERVITAAGWVSYVKLEIYCGLFGTLGRFAFRVALIWSGACGKPTAPSVESDPFNPSIPRVRRTEDGGFGAVARADQLSRVGCAGQSRGEQI